MSTALATVAPAKLRSPAQFGSGTAVQTPAGCVSAFFALEHFDRRSGMATYALRVINRTTAALVCRTWIVSRDGDLTLAHPIAVEIAPLSTGSACVPVWPRDFASCDRALAEVAGDGVHCIVEAPAPVAQLRSGRSAARLAAAMVAGGLLLLGGAMVLRAGIPQIAAFAVPPETLAGTTIHAEYSASGLGALSYVVTAPDGRRLAGGALADAAGAIPIAIPPATQPAAYTLELDKRGLFGTAAATRVLNALPPRDRGGAAIEAISVQPAVAKPGETLNVAYSASGDAGYVRLLGSDGTIWQQQPFSRSGETHFVVPPVRESGEMRVMLHVTKGATAAQSMAGLVVAGAQTPEAVSGQIVADDETTAPAGNADAAGNGTFELEASTVKSGGAIHVKILSPRNGMHLALQDDQSREVSATDVGATATDVTLRAPVVYVPTKYTVVATFTDGFGQESVVEPVTVTP